MIGLSLLRVTAPFALDVDALIKLIFSFLLARAIWRAVTQSSADAQQDSWAGFPPSRVSQARTKIRTWRLGADIWTVVLSRSGGAESVLWFVKDPRVIVLAIANPHHDSPSKLPVSHFTGSAYNRCDCRKTALTVARSLRSSALQGIGEREVLRPLNKIFDDRSKPPGHS